MSNWADEYIKQLDKGESVIFRPQGQSMRPLIESGDLVKVVHPYYLGRDFQIGDIVLCKVNDSHYLHLITNLAVVNDGSTIYEISNNHGKVNGWITIQDIYGVKI